MAVGLVGLDALRRRFVFFSLAPALESEKFAAQLNRAGGSAALVDKIRRCVGALNKQIAADSDLGDGFLVGHSFFCPEVDDAPIGDSWYQAIVDTLKHLEQRGGAHEHCEGLLLYPTTTHPIDFMFDTQGHTLRVLTLDLREAWSDIRVRLLDLRKRVLCRLDCDVKLIAWPNAGRPFMVAADKEAQPDACSSRRLEREQERVGQEHP